MNTFGVEFIFIDAGIGREVFDHFQLKAFVITFLFVFCGNVFRYVKYHITHVYIQTLAKQGIPAFCVDYRTLRVHHIIVFQQTLTDTKVVLFYFFLGTLNRFGNHRMLNHFTIFNSHFHHDVGDSFRTEQPH
ncbi:hypothetical protein D3C87_1482890 [compost metagenome]